MADIHTGLVFPSANIVDVNRDTGVCPDPMLLHQGDKIRLRQVTLKQYRYRI
jgi:hypothetical protein